MRLIVAATAALIVIGVAATAASSSTGQPLILGQTNDSGNDTTTLSASALNASDDPAPTLQVQSGNGEAINVHGGGNGEYPAIAVGGDSSLGGDVYVSGTVHVGGAMTLATSRIVTVPTGANRATSKRIGSMKGTLTYFALATLQEHRPNLWIMAAVPDTTSRTATVYLNRTVTHPVTVAVAVFA